jgi:hypothetical protein
VSGVSGVAWDVLRRRWRAVITVGDVETEIGVFRRKVAAALAHDEEAKKQLGAEVRQRASRVTVAGIVSLGRTIGYYRSRKAGVILCLGLCLDGALVGGFRA